MSKIKLKHNSLNLLFFTFLITVTSCNDKKEFSFSERQKKEISDFDPDFKKYCDLDLSINFEHNAVTSSFYGDYKNALDQATKREFAIMESTEFIADKKDKIAFLENTLQNKNASKNDKINAQNILNTLSAPNASEFAKLARPINAIDFIENKARDYHFTLINEAHYNSEHRSFTTSLLKPLWYQGYRYLALETLSHNDETIEERGYPTESTGYYTKDSHFGNLVREALKIGYKLIPYETKNNNNGTLRDKDQAENIYNQTFQLDKKGKVLIHAGYSHISENGDKGYKPMGYQLKKLVDEDILTIDQVAMIAYNDLNKQNSYYREVNKKLSLDVPTIFLKEDGELLKNQQSYFGIDVQVFHPETKFKNGRPNWMYKSDIKSIPLNSELKKYEKHLIQVLKKDEIITAVPVDQFIISDEKVLLLKTGNYDLRIINCNGDMVATAELVVD